MARSTKAIPSPVPDYQAEEDHRTLTRAQEIREDSGRMRGVKRHHAKQTKTLGKVGRTLGGRR